MGSVLPAIDDALVAWIHAQPIFFVATAPAGPGGHVNCSPRGGDCLRVIGPRTVIWADYTGSGSETIAHLRENGRICLMWCAFAGPPRIVRVHGRGVTTRLDDPAFAGLAARLPANPGTRAIITVEAGRVSQSCGMSVPLMEVVDQRHDLDDWAARKGPDGLVAYRTAKNSRSIDGLAGF
jgi:hypothetical protein